MSTSFRLIEDEIVLDKDREANSLDGELDTPLDQRVENYLSASPPLTHASYWLVVLFIVCATLAAWAIRIEVGVDVNGAARPDGEPIAVGFDQGGPLSKLSVTEGQQVTKGFVLARMDDSEVQLQLERNRADAAIVARQLSEIRRATFTLEHREQPAALREIPLIAGSSASYLVRATASAIESAMADREEAQRKFNMQKELMGTSSTSQSEYDSDRLALQRADALVQHIRETVLDDLTTRATVLSQDSTRLRAERDLLELRARRQILIAPVSGTVSRLAMYRPGQFVQSQEPLLYLLPSDAVTVVVGFLPAAARGRVRVGQEVLVDFASFPRVRYGVARGRVRSIAPDAVRNPENGTLTYRCVFDFYRVEFERNLTNGQRIEPGMDVTVRVLAGKEGLLRYLSDRVMEKVS